MGVERLSDELASSWWAYVRRATVVRADPSGRARVVARLPARTSFGTTEVVLVLERAWAGAEEWLNVRVPVRPNGLTGWVRSRSLERLRHVKRAFRVDVDARTATLFRDGQPLWSGPVCVGAPEWPTPRGRFYVRARVRRMPWAPLYGAFAFCTSAVVPVAPWADGDFVAVHGTNRPERVPGAFSKGCIRLHDRDILQLRELMPVGTPVAIG